MLTVVQKNSHPPRAKLKWVGNGTDCGFGGAETCMRKLLLGNIQRRCQLCV
ncbi:hypothetical protein DPMN_104566 [Dreissena polymorpha]|uniref:Uncharacterized protein n=1 Tax=Dreissena polymorpha TaxID=45954 RepID=A0A9D4K331_DREPO|nr:hypothetical protein DPMN_104566 [Dreissena polymorpha]